MNPINQGGDPLQEALARRQQPQQAPPQPQGMPSPMAGGPPMGGMPQESPLGAGLTDTQLILKALTEKLKSESKIKEAQMIPQEPSMPQQL